MSAHGALLAAAPELLALTRELLSEYEGAGYCPSDALIQRANAVIAKAEGK